MSDSTTTAPQCSLCSAPAVATVFAEHGCLCLDQQTQHRCLQHMMRLHDTNLNDYEIVATFPDFEMLAVWIGDDSQDDTHSIRPALEIP